MTGYRVPQQLEFTGCIRSEKAHYHSIPVYTQEEGFGMSLIGAEEAKKGGNELFVRGEMAGAMKKYSEAIRDLDLASKSSGERRKASSATEVSGIADLLSTCYSNRAACQLKLAKEVEKAEKHQAFLDGCVDDCTRALELKPALVKALFRRSQAYSVIDGKELLAVKDLNKLLHIDPSNAEARKAIQALRVRVDKKHVGVSEVAKIVRVLREGKDMNGRELLREDTLQYLKTLVGLCADDMSHTRDFTRQGGMALAESLISKSFLAPSAKAAAADKDGSIAVEMVTNVMILLGAATQHDDFVTHHVTTADLRPDEQAGARSISDEKDRLSFVLLAKLVAEQQVDSDTSKRILSVLVNILSRLPLKREEEIEKTIPEPPRVEVLPEEDASPPAGERPEMKIQELPYLQEAAGKVFLNAIKSALVFDDHDGDEDSSTELCLHALDCLSTFLSSFSNYLTPDLEVDHRMETLPERKVRGARQRVVRCREYHHAIWALEVGILETVIPAINTRTSSVKIRAIPCFGRLITSACDEKDPDYAAPNVKEGESAPEGDLLVKSYLREYLRGPSTSAPPDGETMPQMLSHARIAGALLACHPEMGVWSLNLGNAMQSIAFLIATGDSSAQEAASEVVCLASATTEGAELLRPLLESGAITQSLLKSPQPATRAAAAAALTKLSIKAKALEQDSPEISQVLNAAFDVIRMEVKKIEGAAKTTKPPTSTSVPSSSSPASSLQAGAKVDSASITSVERAVEVVAAIIGKSYVKEEIVHGSSRIAKATDALAKIVVDPRSTAAYGIAYIFAALTVTNRELRAVALAEKDMTVEQYEKLQELQRIKTKDKDGNDVEEKKEEEDMDTPELCMVRIKRVSAGGAIGCLTRLMGTGSTKTKETCARALRQICVEPTSRGLFIQEGGLKSCCDLIATAPSPSSSSKDSAAGGGGSLTSSEARREAAHAVAKSLVTTNPSLLSAHQRLGVIAPLLDLCRDVDSGNLQQFEALLSLTNILTAGEAEVRRFLKEKGHHAVHYLVFSDHLMVRRAACEVFCNISFEEEVLALMRKPEKVRLWLGLIEEWDSAGEESSEEGYLIARACSGALAGACGDPGVSDAVLSENVGASVKKLLSSEKPELIHRALVMTSQLLQKQVATDDVDAETIQSADNISMAKHFLESDVVLSLTAAVKCVRQIPELHAMASETAKNLVNMCRDL